MNPLYLEMAAFVAIGSCLVGLLVHLVLKSLIYEEPALEVFSWPEYLAGALFVAFVFAPIAVAVGAETARDALKSSNQNINASVVSVEIARTPCAKNGSCAMEYVCGHHTEYYSCDKDGDGDTDFNACSRQVPDYCPYFTEEWTPIIRTNVDDWTGRNPVVWGRVIPNPEYRQLWDPSVPAPEILYTQYGTLPSFFLTIQTQVMEGKTAPTWVVRNTYDSYTLASNVDNPEPWIEYMAQLDSKGLMPTLQTRVNIDGQADRMYFVGMPTPNNLSEFQLKLNQLNTAFGDLLQGDMHVVVMNRNGLDISMEAVLHAIKYRWQDSSIYGDDTFAKNAVLVVLDTLDNQTISRAGLITGMPEEVFDIQYNLDLQQAVRDAFLGKNVPITPGAIFGSVRTPYLEVGGSCDFFNCTRLLGDHILYEGALTPVVFGLNNPETAFQRISMSAEDSDDIGPGFVDLDKLIVPTEQQQKKILLSSVSISLLVWIILILTEDSWKHWIHRNKRNNRYYKRYI